MTASILIVNPKYPHNIGGAIRAAAIFGASEVNWIGERVKVGVDGYELKKAGYRPGKRQNRIPREERMKDYKNVQWRRWNESPQKFISCHCELRDAIPVAVEVRENAESLQNFEHPKNALYVFGGEDETLGRGILEKCHRFVCIPSVIRTPLNLAAAVNVILYDRYTKHLYHEHILSTESAKELDEIYPFAEAERQRRINSVRGKGVIVGHAERPPFTYADPLS